MSSGDFDVLDLVKILLRIADFVRVAQQRSHQTLIQRLQCDDVLSRLVKHKASRSRPLFISRIVSRITAKGVVAHLAIGSQIVWPWNEITRIDLSAIDELIDLSMVLVDPSATFSSSSFVTSTKVSVSTL